MYVIQLSKPKIVFPLISKYKAVRRPCRLIHCDLICGDVTISRLILHVTIFRALWMITVELCEMGRAPLIRQIFGSPLYVLND